jgi:hypothetical protein
VTRSIDEQQKVAPNKVFTDETIVQEAAGKALYALQTNPADIKKIAADLSSFYQEAVRVQYAKSGAAEFGMPAPQSYALNVTKMGLTHVGPDGKPRSVQMLSPVEVEHMLMSSAIKANQKVLNLQASKPVTGSIDPFNYRP